MTLRTFLEYLAAMTVAGAIGALGDPPVSLFLAAAVAITATVDVIDKIDR